MTYRLQMTKLETRLRTAKEVAVCDRTETIKRDSMMLVQLQGWLSIAAHIKNPAPEGLK